MTTASVMKELKELRNRTSRVILVLSLFCLNWSGYSTYSFGKLVFRLSVLSVFFVLNRMFGIKTLKYAISLFKRCSVILLSLQRLTKLFIKTEIQ